MGGQVVNRLCIWLLSSAAAVLMLPQLALSAYITQHLSYSIKASVGMHTLQVWAVRGSLACLTCLSASLVSSI